MPSTTVTTSSANAASLTITKPTGLAVGDLLVAFITAIAGGAFPIDTPAGWTMTLYDSNSSTRKFGVFTKVADSSDVAAANFTFTTSGGASAMVGVLVRCSGVASGSEITASEFDETFTTSSPSFTGASTPATTDSLVLMAMTGWDNGGLITVSGYASTPSKTWTELADLNINQGTIDPFLAVASAQSGSLTQITAYSATLSATPDTCDGALIIIRPPTNATGTNALFSIAPAFFDENGRADTRGTNTLLEVSPTINTQNGRATSPTQWQNEDKPSTAWINDSL